MEILQNTIHKANENEVVEFKIIRLRLRNFCFWGVITFDFEFTVLNCDLEWIKINGKIEFVFFGWCFIFN